MDNDLYAPADEGRIIEPRHTLISVGDTLQSEASRLAVWARTTHSLRMPYEVHQALLGVESAVDRWTELRRQSGGTTDA